MSNDYSDHIEQLLEAQQAAKQVPELTEKQKRAVQVLKPIYKFALQLKASGVIKDVVERDILSDLHNTRSSTFVSMHTLGGTNNTIAMYYHDGEMRAGLPRGYISAARIIGDYHTYYGNTKNRHFNFSNYDGIDAWYDDAFQWVADCITEDVRLKPK